MSRNPADLVRAECVYKSELRLLSPSCLLAGTFFDFKDKTRQSFAFSPAQLILSVAFTTLFHPPTIAASKLPPSIDDSTTHRSDQAREPETTQRASHPHHSPTNT